MSWSFRVCSVVIVTAGTAILGYLMSHIHEYFPRVFSEAASYPYLDSFTTIMSFVAQLLMAHRFVESWLLWILVDLIGIRLYFVKEVIFISFLYVVFLVLAIKGFLEWVGAKDQKK